MSVHRFHAVALTPIHVGDGSTWTPESFRLDGDELVLFEPSAALAALDLAGSKAFAQAIDRGDLRKAQSLLHAAVGKQLELGRIDVSDASRREIGAAIDNPGRAGRIHPFIRSAGRPFMPGSSIKGAIRTAILSDRAKPMLPELVREIEQAGIHGGKSGRLSDAIQRKVLQLEEGQRQTDTDPFRHVSIGDAGLPDRATRIEHVLNLRRDGTANEMPMHFEALRALTRFTVDVLVADGRANLAASKDPRKTTKKPIVLEELRGAVDSFYRTIWESEARRFFGPPGSPPGLPPKGKAVLLRVGRFSHFEAASVEGLRRGHRPQSRTNPTASEGSTRMVIASSGTNTPFGWIALFDKEQDAVDWATGAKTTTPRQAGASMTAPGGQRAVPTPSAGGRLVGFRRGERVRNQDGETGIVMADVAMYAPRMDIKFDADGSVENVSTKGWERT
jgi:CRISPR-associated protein Csm5